MTPQDAAQRPPDAAVEDALRELIRVARNAGMNEMQELGYFPSQRQADDEEISEAVQAVYAALVPAAPPPAALDVAQVYAMPQTLRLDVRLRDAESYNAAYRLLVGHEPIEPAIAAAYAQEDSK